MKLATIKFLLFLPLLVLHTMQAMEQAKPLNKVASLKNQAKQKVINLLETNPQMIEKINSDTFTEDLRKEILNDMHAEQFILLNSCLQNCLNTLPINQGMLNCLQLDETDLYLITGSNNKVARIWDIKTGECLYTLDGHSEGVSAVALNSESKQAFTATYDNKLYFWDLQQDQLKPIEVATEYTITSILIDQKNKHEIITIDCEGISRWNSQTATRLQTISRTGFDSRGNREPINPPSGPTDLTTAGKLNKNDTLFLTGTEQGKAFLWDLKTGRCLMHFGLRSGAAIQLLDFCDNDQRAIIVSEGNLITMVPFNSTQEDIPVSIRINHHIESIVYASNHLAIFRLQDQSYARLTLKTRQVQAMGSLLSLIDYHGKNYMLVGQADGSFDLMELETQRFLGKTQAHQSQILSIDCFIDHSADLVITSSTDGSCKLWNLRHNLTLPELIFVIRLQQEKEKGEIIAYDIDTHRQLVMLLEKHEQSREKFLRYFAQQLQNYMVEDSTDGLKLRSTDT